VVIATLGFSNKGNNWKLVVANFLLIFLIQMAFELDAIITMGHFPTVFEVVKTASSSLVATLIFYGYNRRKGETE